MTFNAKNGEICRGFWNKEAILINFVSESVVEQEKLTVVFQLTKASKVISNSQHVFSFANIIAKVTNGHSSKQDNQPNAKWATNLIYQKWQHDLFFKKSFQ